MALVNPKNYTHPFTISIWYLKTVIAILLLLKIIRHDYDFCYSLVDYITALPCFSRMSLILKDWWVLTHFTNAQSGLRQIISHTSRMSPSPQWRASILLSSNIVGQERGWENSNIRKFTAGISVARHKSYQHLLRSTFLVTCTPWTMGIAAVGHFAAQKGVLENFYHEKECAICQ